MLRNLSIALTTERKLALAALVVTAVTASMAVVGGLSSWQYYLTVEECQADGPALVGKRIRVNGQIAPASLAITADRGSARFRLVGKSDGLEVRCDGPLPDNLAEGIPVVVEGEYRPGGWIEGERVLTRCASKYQSKSPQPALATGPERDG